MREILPLIQRPSHYLGTEMNAVHKDPEQVDVRLALAFPDLYEIGMSYIGQRILAHMVNRHERFWAERVFAPGLDAARLLRERGLVLTTLESDTPLNEMDVVAFSLTHELCYTNVLYMLDLAGIPLRTSDRTESHPLVVAGGGCTFNAEPLAPFLDVMVLGDGEEVVIDLLEAVDRAKKNGHSRERLLTDITRIPGIYVPSLFEPRGRGEPLHPLLPDYATVEKRVIADLDSVEFPTRQVVPFGKVIHDRLSLEIARGCTRGCRFCQAGMLYRPVRERSLPELDRIIEQGLDQTGFEELSFLSLSTGDFSALTGLFEQSIARCRAEQVSVSLPSLRVGSLDAGLMERIARIRRTGVTLAPEAGTQRLRDVINKGITEEELLEHVTKLFSLGWQSVKLYFMIGLPTETREDLDGILDLCRKVQACAGKRAKRLQITASFSPFVPKPHTPFQWERQISREETAERLEYLKTIFRPYRKISLRWHDPDMSFLEGIFSRGDRELAPLVEEAYRRGAVFTSWVEHLQIETWKELMDELSVDQDFYLGARDPEGSLPWDHLTSGVTRSFLKRERERALAGRLSPDCRFDACINCGVCNTKGRPSTLERQNEVLDITPRVNLTARDQGQEETTPLKREPAGELHEKAVHWRVWYEKLGPAKYLSQLELQRLFERTLRRSGAAMTFSAGFHPLPLISFGRALPVGVASREEWFNVFLRREMDPEDLLSRANAFLPEGLVFLRVDRLSMGKKQPQALSEEFLLEFHLDAASAGEALGNWDRFMGQSSFAWENQSKNPPKTIDLRPFVRQCTQKGSSLGLEFDWEQGYISPLTLVQAVNPALSLDAFELIKTRQRIEYRNRAPQQDRPEEHPAGASHGRK
ncbi:MAG: TIGR03960 family B12-binding radical SAM protein [Desulfovibrionales bacterium]